MLLNKMRPRAQEENKLTERSDTYSIKNKTAVLHRECYIRLQKLHDSRSDVEVIEDTYHDIVSSYPNHSDADFDRLILSRTLFHSAGIVDPNGKPLTWNWAMLGKFLASQILFWLSPILILVVSVGSIYWLW